MPVEGAVEEGLGIGVDHGAEAEAEGEDEDSDWSSQLSILYIQSYVLVHSLLMFRKNGLYNGCRVSCIGLMFVRTARGRFT